MTDNSYRLAPTLSPAMPRLAALAANDLARPMRNAHDGLRAIEQWFVQNGDPYTPLEPQAFMQDFKRQLDTFDLISGTQSNAELLARIQSALRALKTRLDLAAMREELPLPTPLLHHHVPINSVALVAAERDAACMPPIA